MGCVAARKVCSTLQQTRWAVQRGVQRGCQLLGLVQVMVQPINCPQQLVACTHGSPSPAGKGAAAAGRRPSGVQSSSEAASCGGHRGRAHAEVRMRASPPSCCASGCKVPLLQMWLSTGEDNALLPMHPSADQPRVHSRMQSGARTLRPRRRGMKGPPASWTATAEASCADRKRAGDEGRCGETCANTSSLKQPQPGSPFQGRMAT